ncbi:hypothetical protein A2U01_0117157, partial [Trifolium medium]|nr:hypothetical protein [Trifolium medium]
IEAHNQGSYSKIQEKNQDPSTMTLPSSSMAIPMFIMYC